MDYSQFGNKKRGRSPQTTRVRNKVGLLILRISISVMLIVGFAGLGAGIGVYMGILNNSPELDIRGLGPISPRAFETGFLGAVPGNSSLTSFIVCAKTGEERERLHAGINSQFVSLGDVPQHLIYAFVAIEDERFFEHNGVDPRGIMRALYVNFFDASRTTTEGASTITQQLVKNMLSVRDNTFITKLQEQHIAINFENHLVEEFARLGYANPRDEAKNFIIQSYLNIVPLGQTNIGVQAAAWFYYGVCVSELSIVQSATIASITQWPTRFPPDIRPQNNWRRTKLVLRNMHRLGFISDEEYEEALQERPVLDPETGEQLYDDDGEPLMLGIVYDTIFRTDGGGTRQLTSEFDCFTDALLSQVREDLIIQHGLTPDRADWRIFESGIRIYSTQDTQKQAAVDRAFLDESLWPGQGVGFTIEVTHYMSVNNSITQENRHYRRQHDAANIAAAEKWVENLRESLLTHADVIVEERTFMTPQPQGAFVLIDHHTGHVLAMRGIRGEKQTNRAFNRATEATRSPGSQMKPLAPFAPLIDLGIMQPATVIDDIPFYLANPSGRGWRPGNHWGANTFRGLSTLRNAIYASGNVVSARAAADPTIPHAGVSTMVSYLEKMGISTIAPHDGAAMVLGGMTHGTKLIELTGAYATIANLGEYNRPVLYTRVLDHAGNIILENPHNPQRVLRATTAYLLTDCMKDTIGGRAGATGGRANWSAGSGLRGQIPIAGKTGTSQSNRDLGFAGFTPYFTAAIWMGNDNETPLHTRAREFHTPLWRVIMEEVHKGLPARSFERPQGITSASACLDSGHTPTSFCQNDPRGNRSRSEIFAIGQTPSQSCRVHQEFTYCTESEMLANTHCPDWAVVTRVGIVRSNPIDDISASVSDRYLEFPLTVRQGLTCTYHFSGGWDSGFTGGNFWDGMHQNPEHIICMITGLIMPNPNYIPTSTPLPPNEFPTDNDSEEPAESLPIPTPTPMPTPTPQSVWGGLGPAAEPTVTPPPFVHTVPIPGLN
jgi:penicillin-binding protein 1A